MEQARFWMWTKRKEGLSSHLQAPINNSYDDSWEEQAFAEDTAGALGGCVWPPRSYSCTFCRREFRSAQALGGHMNVHRRDRARLKQSPTSHAEILHQDPQKHHNHLQNPYTSLGFQYPSQICTLVYTSPNPSSDPGSTIVSPSSPPRVSTTTQENSTKKTSLFTALSSSNMEEEHNNASNPTSLRPFCPNLGEGEKNSSVSIDQSGCRAMVDYLKTDLSVSLNLVVRRTRPITISDDEEDEEPVACKRRRTESALPLFLKSNNNPVDRRSPCFIEELDLELRLGDRPKVQ